MNIVYKVKVFLKTLCHKYFEIVFTMICTILLNSIDEYRCVFFKNLLKFITFSTNNKDQLVHFGCEKNYFYFLPVIQLDYFHNSLENM